jgi:hypothetical protein
MRRRKLVMISIVLWLQTVGLAMAAPQPAKVVEQFIEAILQGHFAASRSFTLERVNLSGSLFSNWLFGPVGAGGDAATADLFLSRRFIQTFRYSIIGTTPTGDNQVMVAAIRSSPNIAHMYTWALAPKRGAAPYELIEAVDTYLTKINFPVEESRMQFVLVREVDSWYISAVFDEKFTQLQQQLQGQTQLSAAVPLQGSPAPTGTGDTPGTPPAATTTSSDIGRQLADAQFNATLQGFNRAAQGLPPGSGASGSGNAAAPKKDEDEPGFFGKISRALFGTKKNDAVAKNIPPSMTTTLKNVRDAIARFAVANNSVPDTSQLYDWKSLRRIVNQYGRTSLPATEEEAGFSFVDYKPGTSREGYLLVVDLREPQDGVKRIEIEDSTAVRPGPR